MGETKLTEREVEKRCERGHPASVIARLFAVSMAKRLRWVRGAWQQYNAVSMKYSTTPDIVVGGMIGTFISTIGKTLLGDDEGMAAAINAPDFGAIEAACRIMLDPNSRFLTAPVAAPTPAQPQTAPPRGLKRVPSEPLGARRRASKAMRV